MDSSQIELDDLVYSYPKITNPNFQTLVSNKEEYRQLASKPRESIPDRGEFFLHQRLIHRYLLTYDRVLLFNVTGTGKTASGAGAAEMFLDAAVNASIPFIDVYNNPIRTHINLIYVLVKGPVIRQEFKSQLKNKISREGKYKSDIQLGKNYKFMTYSKFAGEVATHSLDPIDIREKYSGSMFIVDEVHQMIPSENDTLIIDNLEEDDNNNNKSKNSKKISNLKKKTETYETIKLVFQSIVRSKILLLSATPMINDPSEIGSIMNLILPINEQMSTNINYNTITLPEIEPYLRSRVSYIRELESEVIPVYMGKPMNIEYEIGDKIQKSQEIVYTTIMSTQSKDFIGQSQGYINVATEKKKQRALLSSEQQASLFVFPDGSSGHNGFKKYVEVNTLIKKKIQKNNEIREIQYEVYKASEELLPWLEDITKLRQLSSKYSEIVEFCKIPEENVFVYNNKVMGSGSIVLTLCLQAQGFDKFDRTDNIFYKLKDGESERKTSIDGRLRYAFYTSGQSQELQQNILKTYNSYENRHGKYIKVLIVSEVGGEGINVSNVQQVHIAVPWWNRAQIYQAISRAFRATSHVDLIAEAREKNSRSIKIPVRIYQHLAMLDPSIDINIKIPSSDAYMYETSELKNIRIKRIERMLKQSAFDCQLHYNRNVRGGENYSADCDYDICDYKCYPDDHGEKSAKIDMSSYDMLYANETIKGLELLISDIFKEKFYITYSELYPILSDYNINYIQRAVTNIINDKKRITNRMGFSSYIQEDSGYIFLQQTYPIKDGQWLSQIYGSSIMSTEIKPLIEYISKLQKIDDINIVNELKNLNPFSSKFEQLVSEISLDSLIDIVEDAIIMNNNPELVEKYQDYIWTFNKPTKAIEAVAAGSDLSYDQIKDLMDDSIVIVHNLNKLQNTQTKYAKTSQVGKVVGDLRVFENIFKTATNPEQIVYTNLIENEIVSKIKDFDQFNIYGIIYNNNPDLYINVSIFSSGKDKRSKSRGRNCSTFKISELIRILLELNIESDEYLEEDIEIMENKVEGSGINIDKLTDDDIIFLYSWLISKNKKKQRLCELIYNKLEELDQILYI